jgi:hypothetical protein
MHDESRQSRDLDRRAAFRGDMRVCGATRRPGSGIRIVDHPELETTTRVQPDGTINFPYVGRTQAAGRSEDDLGRAVGRRLVELKTIAEQ